MAKIKIKTILSDVKKWGSINEFGIIDSECYVERHCGARGYLVERKQIKQLFKGKVFYIQDEDRLNLIAVKDMVGENNE